MAPDRSFLHEADFLLKLQIIIHITSNEQCSRQIKQINTNKKSLFSHNDNVGNFPNSFFFFLVTTVNNTHELGPLVEIRIPANESSLILKNLNYSTRYKFYFNAQTSVGSGSQITEEAVTIMDEGKMGMYKENPLSLKTTTNFIENIATTSFPLRK